MLRGRPDSARVRRSLRVARDAEAPRDNPFLLRQLLERPFHGNRSESAHAIRGTGQTMQWLATDTTDDTPTPVAPDTGTVDTTLGAVVSVAAAVVKTTSTQ